jgi:hypothetical protein
MAEYECFPLWISTAKGVENVDPADLPLTPHLAGHLTQWAQDYDGTLNREDPSASGFVSDEAESDFYERGRRLALRLIRELAGRYRVEYFDGRSGAFDSSIMDN